MPLLVLEPAGLGDAVHSLPMLRALARAGLAPGIVCTPAVAGLFALTPWLGPVVTTPVPKPGLAGAWRFARGLKGTGADRLLVPMASDRTSLMAAMSGIAPRIGRVPMDGGPVGWQRLFTTTVQLPWNEQAMFRQKLALARAACRLDLAEPPPGGRPDFGVDPGALPALPSALAGRPYLHLSPNAGAAHRERPLDGPAGLTELLARLHRQFPDHALVLTAAPVPRETARLEALVARLPGLPVVAYPGTLGVAALASVIGGARLHLGGDTGSLHLAFLADTPTVAWYGWHPGWREWVPEDGRRFCVLLGRQGDPQDSTAIGNDLLLEAARRALRP